VIDPQLVERVRAHLLEQGVAFPDWGADVSAFRASIVRALVNLGYDKQGSGQSSIHEIAAELAQRLTGVGVLQPFLDDPDDTIQEIIVRRGYVQLERSGCIEDVGALALDAEFHAIVNRTADRARRQITGSRPYVLADLPDGSRFTAILEPLSVEGTAINIRRFPRKRLTLWDLEVKGTFAPRTDDTESLSVVRRNGNLLADYLAHLARNVLGSILISGEFSAGKSTLLGALASQVPTITQVAVVETFKEVQLAHPHPLRVVVPGDRADFPAMDEVLNVVITRMRPDLLIVGEIVREEAPRFLDAVNLGKRAWSTIHAGSALGALHRLETKALASGLPHQAIREQIALSVDVVVHMARSGAERHVAEVALVQGLSPAGEYDLQYLPIGRVVPRAKTLEAIWAALKPEERV
jgi:pilus assembly protein CpaF